MDVSAGKETFRRIMAYIHVNGDIEVQHELDQFHKAQWFFSDSTGVEQFVEEFAKKNKDIFDLEAEEHKLEYTEVYKKFQDSFEQKIEVRAARWPIP